MISLENNITFITGGSDGNIKIWDTLKKTTIFEFKK